MKSVFLTINLLILLVTYGHSQLINEEFNTNLPSNWTQWGIVTWGHNNNFNCAEAYASGVTGSGWLQTPFVNLTQLTNPKLSFKVASIRDNFIAPNVSLWYNTGAGWQFLERWGGGNNVTTIPQTADFIPPLDSANVTWVTIDYDLSALANNTNIRFSFGADYDAGGTGWVLVDSVVLYNGPAPMVYNLPYLQDFEGSTFLPQDWEAFGGVNAAWQLNMIVGGFGNSSQSAYFNNRVPFVSGNFYGMRSVLLDLTGASQPMLEFDVAYAQATSNTSDQLGVWYSFNGQTGWQSLINYSFNTLATAPPQNSLFVPTALQWEKKTVNLSAFTGSSLIRFAFENNSSGVNAVYIDNVHFYDAAVTTNVATLTTSEIEIFPNPFECIFTLNHTEQVTSIAIYNPIGIKVYEERFSKGENQIRIEALENYPAQAYLLVVKMDNGISRNYTILKK